MDYEFSFKTPTLRRIGVFVLGFSVWIWFLLTLESFLKKDPTLPRESIFLLISWFVYLVMRRL